MSTLQMLDAAGRPRSPATVPGYLAGRPPRNEGLRYPADPPRGLPHHRDDLLDPGTESMVHGSALWSSCCGAPGYGSARH